MVDPNRKINRLTDKDIEFLDECEEEFSNRYTEEDEDFMLHMSKPLADPPIVENWGFLGNNQSNHRGGGGQRNNFYDSDRGQGGMRNNRGWHNRRGNERGPSGNYGRNRHNQTPYSREHRNSERRYNDGRGSESSDQQRPPMNVRRDYGNFVAASKD